MKYLMHPNCLDICLKQLERGGYEWWNLGYVGKPWYMQDALKPRNLEQWIDITDKVNNVRTEAGLPK